MAEAVAHRRPVLAHFRTLDGLTGTDFLDEPSETIYRALAQTWLGPDLPTDADLAPRTRRYRIVRWDSGLREAWYREVLG